MKVNLYLEIQSGMVGKMFSLLKCNLLIILTIRDSKRYGLFRANSSEGIVLIDISISGFGEEINVYKDKELIATESTDDFDDYEVDPDYGEYGYGAPTPSIRRSSSVSYSSDAGPRLVSIDDVKSRTQVPDSLNRNPLPERVELHMPAEIEQ